MASTRATRRRALAGEKRGQPRVPWVDEVSQHVHVAAGVDGGDLDAADRVDAALARAAQHLAVADAVVS